MDWDKLRIFHTVAEVGSLTHAGDALRLSQSAVSRQIRNLELSLNATLFHRHARGLILTEQGELLYEATKVMDKRLEGATARIRDSKDKAFGELRVTSTVGFGTLWLAPRLVHLYDEYPELSIDLMLEERVLDLPMREADVAIRMKEPSQADLIRRRLMDVTIRFYCSKDYAEKYGLPQNSSELREHRLISQKPNAVQVSAGARWLQPYLMVDDQKHFFVNNYYGILQAVRSNLGIGALPSYLATDSHKLVRVLPETESAVIPVYIAYPEELKHSQRVKVFRDFVLEEIVGFRKQLEDMTA